MSASVTPEQDNPEGDHTFRLFDLGANDPRSELIDRAHVDPDTLTHITELMTALANLRDAENALSEASQRYMQLGKTDMRALHFLMVAGNQNIVITPGALAEHLDISTASTTKLLDRLERGGHIRRAPHPHDRRALRITITDETRASAMQTVGQMQARRFHAAARLNREERDTVIRFLNDMTKELSLGHADWGAAEA